MSIVLNSSGGGSVTIQEPSTASNFTQTLPTGTGTVVVSGINSAITSGTAVASTSGTSIDFTSIPSWVKRITVMLNGVSTSGGNDVIIQIGTSSGVTTSGYLGSSTSTLGSTIGSNNYTSGFGIRAGGSAAGGIVRQGSCTICLLGSNIWTESGVFAHSNEAGNVYSAGTVTLSGTLDRVRITTAAGTETFDAGTINILYE